MASVPTTTQLGPDQARLHALMRRLAEVTSTDAPILSVYLDLRPQLQGERPGERNELTVLRDRLKEISGSLPVRGPARSSFDADRERIERLLDEDDLRSHQGAAIFACEAIGLWEVATAEIAFDTRVTAGPTADLFQLARLLDESESVVVAVADTNTCRLFVMRRGRLVERAGLDEPTAEHTRHDQGGWSQARFQRHIDMQDQRFAGEIAEAIDRLVDAESARHVILAAEERALTVLEGELRPRTAALVEHVARIDMRATPEDVAAEVRPLLGALEEASGGDVVERVLAGVRSGGLGVLGLEATMQALEAGQVDELVVVESAATDEELRGELLRQAALTDARVEVVPEHEELSRHDGIGATLRFRIG